MVFRLYSRPKIDSRYFFFFCKCELRNIPIIFECTDEKKKWGTVADRSWNNFLWHAKMDYGAFTAPVNQPYVFQPSFNMYFHNLAKKKKNKREEKIFWARINATSVRGIQNKLKKKSNLEQNDDLYPNGYKSKKNSRQHSKKDCIIFISLSRSTRLDSCELCLYACQ